LASCSIWVVLSPFEVPQLVKHKPRSIAKVRMCSPPEFGYASNAVP
jgi:hypothetical protein